MCWSTSFVRLCALIVWTSTRSASGIKFRNPTLNQAGKRPGPDGDLPDGRLPPDKRRRLDEHRAGHDVDEQGTREDTSDSFSLGIESDIDTDELPRLSSDLFGRFESATPQGPGGLPAAESQSEGQVGSPQSEPSVTDIAKHDLDILEDTLTTPASSAYGSREETSDSSGRESDTNADDLPRWSSDFFGRLESATPQGPGGLPAAESQSEGSDTNADESPRWSSDFFGRFESATPQGPGGGPVVASQSKESDSNADELPRWSHLESATPQGLGYAPIAPRPEVDSPQPGPPLPKKKDLEFLKAARLYFDTSLAKALNLMEKLARGEPTKGFEMEFPELPFTARVLNYHVRRLFTTKDQLLIRDARNDLARVKSNFLRLSISTPADKAFLESTKTALAHLRESVCKVFDMMINGSRNRVEATEMPERVHKRVGRPPRRQQKPTPSENKINKNIKFLTSIRLYFDTSFDKAEKKLTQVLHGESPTVELPNLPCVDHTFYRFKTDLFTEEEVKLIGEARSLIGFVKRNYNTPPTKSHVDDEAVKLHMLELKHLREPVAALFDSSIQAWRKKLGHKKEPDSRHEGHVPVPVADRHDGQHEGHVPVAVADRESEPAAAASDLKIKFLETVRLYFDTSFESALEFVAQYAHGQPSSSFKIDFPEFDIPMTTFNWYAGLLFSGDEMKLIQQARDNIEGVKRESKGGLFYAHIIDAASERSFLSYLRDSVDQLFDTAIQREARSVVAV